MGVVNQGIPRDIVRELAQLSGATVFIETGTFRGDTARWASGLFSKVHTIELSKVLYDQARLDLAGVKGVCPHFGDSASVLPKLVQPLGDARAIYWLDGHWSGGETAGEDHECPLMAELRCLLDRPQDIILIDDARLFLCAPPPPHRPEQWPTIADIVRVFDETPRFFQIIQDVIYILPNEPQLISAVIRYAQASAESPSKRTTGFPLRRFAGSLLGA